MQEAACADVPVTSVPRTPTRPRDLSEAKRRHALKLERCLEMQSGRPSTSRVMTTTSSGAPCEDCMGLFPFRSCSNTCHVCVPNDPLSTKLLEPTKLRAAEARPPLSVIRVGCEMPLQDRKSRCKECMDLGPFKNCSMPKHMTLCNAEDTWIACEHCHRVLCPRHSRNVIVSHAWKSHVSVTTGSRTCSRSLSLLPNRYPRE